MPRNVRYSMVLVLTACSNSALASAPFTLLADGVAAGDDTVAADASPAADGAAANDSAAASDSGAAKDTVAAKDAAADAAASVDALAADVPGVACAGAPVCLAIAKPGCAKNGQPCAALAVIVDGDGNPLDGSATGLAIPLGSVQLGASTDLEVRLRNEAPEATAAALHIASVAFDYTPLAKEENAATGKLALTCWDGGMENPCAKAKWLDLVPDRVEPTASQASLELVRIRFLHLDDQPRTGKLPISLGGKPAWQGKQFGIPVATVSGAPKLGVPAQLVFAAGKASTLPLPMQIKGGAILQLKSASLKGSKAFQVQIGGGDVPFDIKVMDAPITIAAGQQVVAQVTCSGAAGAQATLTLDTNDPAAAATTVHQLVK